MNKYYLYKKQVEIAETHIGNHKPVTVTINDRGSNSDSPQRQGKNTSLILLTARVHIHKTWTLLFYLYYSLKKKETPVGCTTLAPCPIAMFLYNPPNLYK